MIVFDTDVISYVLRASPPIGLIRKIGEIDPKDHATTSINVGELVYGAHRSEKTDKYMKALEERVWPNVIVLPFDHRAAEVYGQIRAELEKKGVVVAEPDLRIASICVSRDTLLATGNLKHFSKIPELEVEDWLAPFR